ncbi:hypothetical protein GE278_17270 [Enterobacteriaceae bacterium Kacie_13]|nr:hypothetical protein GE278_17270 [Enterobacteriaceae bacterium Kacie_13]
MIVTANPVVSGVTPGKSANTTTSDVSFSATLEQAYPTQKNRPALAGQQAKTPGEASEKPEDGQPEAPPVQTLPAELPPVEIITQMPLPDPQTDGEALIDPQLLALQQMVAQNVQVAPVMQPPATGQTAAPQPAEAVEEQGADIMAKPLADAAPAQVQERQNTAFVLPESMKPKAVAEAAQSATQGKQGTDKVASEQHDAFLSMMNKAETQKESATAQLQFRPEMNRTVPLQQEPVSMLIPEAGARAPFSTVSELASVAAPATASPAALNQALGTPAWQQALSQQLAYFTRNGIHDAQLRLHPEDLGSLQINLRLKNDQAQLHFVTENHQVRAALEAAMPHLRTSLAESGIHLGQSSVGADSSSSWSTSAQNDNKSNQGHVEDDGQEAAHLKDENTETSTKTLHYSNGINTFV